MAIEMGAYSFLSNTLNITGPSGSVQMGGPDTAAADEGFSWSYVEDSNIQEGGADGSTMNSFAATRRAKLTVRLQKTSPVNTILQEMWSGDRANGGVNWGLNVITHRDVIRGDSLTGRGCAFTKFPNITAAKAAGNIEWSFDISILDPILGSGPATIMVP
jgi:structural protein KPP10_ORF10